MFESPLLSNSQKQKHKAKAYCLPLPSFLELKGNMNEKY